MIRSPRILTPAGQIVRYLITKNKSRAMEIAANESIALSTIYSNLKDLLIAGWVAEKEGKYIITPSGVKAYLSEVLPGVDVSRLVGLAKIVGVSPMRLVGVGVRVMLAILEAAYVPADLAKLLGSHDPSVLDELEFMFERRDKQAQAEEVVA